MNKISTPELENAIKLLEELRNNPIALQYLEKYREELRIRSTLNAEE
jgi:hypothetical protein